MATTLTSRCTWRTALLAVAIAAVSSAASAEGVRKLDTVLEARARQVIGRSRVIVQFADAPDVRAILGARGLVGRRLGRLGAQVAELDNTSLAALAADPRVARVTIDRPAFATMERTGPTVGATAARDDFDVTGRGIGVAVIDSGVTAWHDDLYTASGAGHGPRVVAFKDFTQPDTPVGAFDPYGHGTHVAGIIAGNGADSDGRRTGIAPGARIVALKVLDENGGGYISDVIAALDYAVSIKDAYNIRVVNLSVGAAVTESYLDDPLTLAARRAVDAGLVVVAAAGNLGKAGNGGVQYGGITAPGNAPWVLTVGASSHQGTITRADDIIAAFSSRGPTWIDFSAKPDLVAPGVGIESLSDPYSTLYRTYPGLLLDGTTPTWYHPYMSLTGTSMAAPVVTGTVALMLEANPALTPNAVKAILEYTAQHRAATSPLAQGAGLLNAHGAVRLARSFAHPGDRLGPMSDLIAGERIAWSRDVIWGNYRVTGGVLTPNANAWSAGQTWGALTTNTGSPVVWGRRDAGVGATNIVWSTGVYSADDGNIVWSTGTHGIDDGNIVWSTSAMPNIVWGTDCGGANCQGVVWGTARAAGGVWGTSAIDDGNIVWSTGTHSVDDGNIVWSTGTQVDDGNIVWSTSAPDQVIWTAPAVITRRRDIAGR